MSLLLLFSRSFFNIFQTLFSCIYSSEWMSEKANSYEYKWQFSNVRIILLLQRGIRSVNSIVIILEFFPAPTLMPVSNMLLSFVKNMSFLWRFNACSRYNEWQWENIFLFLRNRSSNGWRYSVFFCIYAWPLM